MKKALSSLLISLSVLSAPTMGVMSIRTYEASTGFYQSWQSGKALKAYRVRNAVNSGRILTGELKGGLRSCIAIVNAGIHREPCDRQGLSLLR